MTVKKSSPLPFEVALAELEAVVGQLEQGDLSLEEALQRFERGVGLVRSCQDALQAAERTVSRLVERDGALEILPFDAAD
ncbi:MAG: exodeoxyribonuclease VII small subunit [Candidatus Competibacter sp.]|nr:exodeoxyribonuclease VII small subunit [Candidatus Competibacter sp.]